MATRSRTIPAVVLAAGDGGRLGLHTADLPKPLVPIGGRPLIDYTLGALAQAGIEEVVIVTGYRRTQLERHLLGWNGARLSITFVHNEQFERGASLSLATARPLVEDRPFLLTMADHLLSAELISRLLEAAREHPDRTFVAADAGQRTPRYVEEATKLRIDPLGRVTAIGKELRRWSALDTGAFVVTPPTWDAVDAVEHDCELGVIFSEVARRRELYAADVSGCFWYDVDTEEDLLEASELIGGTVASPLMGPPVTLAMDGDPAPV